MGYNSEWMWLESGELGVGLTPDGHYRLVGAQGSCVAWRTAGALDIFAIVTAVLFRPRSHPSEQVDVRSVLWRIEPFFDCIRPWTTYPARCLVPSAIMSSLFGQAANANTGSSLFGGSNNNTTNANQPSSLFGNSQQQGSNPGQGSSLFGNANTNNNNTTGPSSGAGLFGNTNPSANTNANTGVGASLFGGNPGTNNQSVFGTNNNNPQASQATNFGASINLNQMSQQQMAAMQLQSGLGSSVASGLNGVLQQELLRSRLQAGGIDPQSGQKTVFDQAKTLIQKWDPQSQDTLLQGYMYNSTSSILAPYHTRNADDDEKSWEAALANRPAPLEGPNGMQTSFVPVLCRGFKALSDRVEFQSRAIQELRARLHEMNNCLNAVMNVHQQRILARLDTSRRQHTALSQRCLRLVVKVQVLRNRGYALDGGEEVLRQKLMQLEQQVLDPTFAGREEEIWARMVALRERSRWLEEEGRRIGQKVQDQQNGSTSVPDEVLQKTKKILLDYEGQLVHLNKELTDVKGEYEIWEQTRVKEKGVSTVR
nr:nucleoporin nup57 [Quercus suber]